MAIKLSNDEFQAIRTVIESLCGITLSENKAYLVESRLNRLVFDCGLRSFGELAHKLKDGRDAALLNQAVDLMTTNETLWFRDVHPYRFFQEQLLPLYESAFERGRREPVRIWSAACSTGQEPYSLAMLILGHLASKPRLKPGLFEILGTDISETCLATAKSGEYDRLAMGRGLPEEFRQRFFVEQGRGWRIDEQVRKMVTFRKFNLQQSFSSLGRFDLILCRNVAIYFSTAFRNQLYAKVHLALQPNGHFIVGASESLSGYSQDFTLFQYGEGFYYRPKGQSG